MNEIDPLEEVLQHLSEQTPAPPRETQTRAEFLSAVRLVSNKNHHQPPPQKRGGKLMRFVTVAAAGVIITVLALAGTQLMETENRVAQEPIHQVPEQTEPEIMYWYVSIEDLILLSDFELLVPATLPADYVFEFGSYREEGKTIEMDYSCHGMGSGRFSFLQQTERIDFLPYSEDDFVQEVEIATPERGRITGRYITGEWSESKFQQYSDDHGYGMIGWYPDGEVAAYQSLLWSDEERGIYYQLITINAPYYENYSSCHLSREDLITFAWNLEVANAANYPPSNIVLQPQLFTRAESDMLPSDIAETTPITGLTWEEAEALAGYPLPEIQNPYYRFKEAQFDEASARVTLVYEYGGTKTDTFLLHTQPVPMRPSEQVFLPDLIGENALVRQIPLERAVGEYLHGSWLDENTPYLPPGWTPQWMDQMEEQRLRWQWGALIYELEMPLELVTPETKELLPLLANQIIKAQGDQAVGSSFMPTEEEMTAAADATANAQPQSFGNAVAGAVFPVMMPTALPKSFHFAGGSARQSGTSVFLSYDCMWANLWLEQSLSTTPQRLPGVGASANVETVQVGDVEGQYVVGSWEMPELDLEPGERAFYIQTWNNDLPVQQLMWNSKGMQYFMMLQEIGEVRNAANYTDECQFTREEMVAVAESLVPSEELGIQPTALLQPSDLFVRHTLNEYPVNLGETISRTVFLEEAATSTPISELPAIEEIVDYGIPIAAYIPEGFELYTIKFSAERWVRFGYYDPENYTHRLYINLQPAENEIGKPSYMADPPGLDYIGANTAVQQVLIGDLPGEYVIGDWRVDTRHLSLTPNDDGTYTAIWMPDLAWQRLRWEQDGVLIEIETGDKTTLNLDSPLPYEELIRIAESFSTE